MRDLFMVKPGGAAWIEDARNKAQAQFAQAKKQESEVWREREKQRLADTEKTAQLKALRLAKEAADKEAALLAPKPVRIAKPATAGKPKVTGPKRLAPGVIRSEED
jgi:hypothetical protein